MDERGYYIAIGYQGQFIYVEPKMDLVVVFTSELADEDFYLPEMLLNEYVLRAVE